MKRTSWAMGSLALSMLLSSLGTSSANVALPTLAQAFAASFAQVQWVVLTYLLAITILIVSAGKLGDLLGHRRMLLVGIVVFVVASALCGAASALWMLIAARVMQGVGAAILMALTMALVRETVPKERTGSAMGLLGTMSAIGTALGPSLGGLLIAVSGWRAIFLVMVPLAALNFLLAFRYLPADGERKKPEFDPAGTLLLALALAAYALGVTIQGRGWLNGALLLAAVVASVFFVRVKRAEIAPASPYKRQLATNTLVATVMMTTLVVGPFYLSRALGLSTALVGAVMSVGPIISALTGFPAGRIVDRRGAPFTVVIGLAAMLAGCLALAVLPGMWGYVAALAMLTPGYQLFQAANNTAVMTDVRADQRGVVSGVLSLSRNLGLITGASVMGALFAMATKDSPATANPEAITTGMRISFSLTAVLIATALLISVAGRSAALLTRTRTKDEVQCG